VCNNCGYEVPAAKGTCRNHCTKCLWSKHVDVNPGDRACECHGLMRPKSCETKGGQIVRILHECVKCKKIQPNRVAEDDNRDIVLGLISEGY